MGTDITSVHKIMKKIYLDYAATTPVDPRVLRAMQPYFSRAFGNPGSVHAFGQEAIAALDASRETVAKAIGADFREIIFTGSATEANNLALRGALLATSHWGLGSRVRSSVREKKKVSKSLNPSGHTPNPRIIISAVEHESVRETARDLEKDGVEVVEIPVDGRGVVDLKKLEASLNDRTILISVMYANNEVGTIQPIAEISKIVRNFREESGIMNKELRKNPFIHNSSFLHPLFHTDAAQAFQYLDCDPSRLGVDLMTLSAHKIYGPKGVGALYVGSGVWGLGSRAKKSVLNSSGYTPYPIIYPITTGGGQEFGLRSGTENVPFIVGFAKAVELAVLARAREGERVQKLTDYFWNGLKKIFPGAEVNGGVKGQGSWVMGQGSGVTGHGSSVRGEGVKYQVSGVGGGGVRRQVSGVKKDNAGVGFLPNILNVYFPGLAAEYLVTKLDLAGIAVSAGSACASRAARPSRVLESFGFSPARAKESVRFSFGRPTTKSEIDTALRRIKIVLKVSKNC